MKTPPAYVRRTLDYWASKGIPFLPGLTMAELHQIDVELKADIPEGVGRAVPATEVLVVAVYAALSPVT